MGRSGLQLSVLSFGSWVSFHKQIDDSAADELMGIAYDHGVNFFDNAEVYALGESEKMMGRVISKKGWDRSSYVLSSKAFWGWRGKENKPNQTGLSRKHLYEACTEALHRLQTDYLDLYYCHRPDKNVPIEEVVWTMHNLVQQGKILYWGTSEWSAAEIQEAHAVAKEHHLIAPVMEQPQYNMFHRERVEQEYAPLYGTVGLGTTVWSPLASGILSGKHRDTGANKGTRLTMEGLDWLRERELTEPAPRFGAGITAVLLLIVLFLWLTGSPVAATVLLAVIALLFAWGAFAGVQRHPYGVLYRRFVRPRLAPPTETEDPAPPTFAQGVGLFVTGVGLVLALAGVSVAVPIAAAMAFIAAFLNSVFGYCLGCQLYVLLVRARVIRRGPAAG